VSTRPRCVVGAESLLAAMQIWWEPAPACRRCQWSLPVRIALARTARAAQAGRTAQAAACAAAAGPRVVPGISRQGRQRCRPSCRRSQSRPRIRHSGVNTSVAAPNTTGACASGASDGGRHPTGAAARTAARRPPSFAPTNSLVTGL